VRSVSAVCEGLVGLGHEVTVLTTTAGLPPAEVDDVRREFVGGVDVRYYNYNQTLLGITSPALNLALPSATTNADIAHVTAVWQPIGPPACASVRRAGLPFVISPRGSMGRYSLRRSWLKKLAYFAMWERSNFANAAGFHFTSHLEQRETQFLAGKRPVLISPNIIRTGDWFEDPVAGVQFRERLQIDNRTPILLSAGRQHHKKGLELIPQALHEVRDLPWMMVFAGFPEDATANRLRTLCKALNLSSRVRFLPGLSPSELRCAYNACKLLLIPSLHENFGNTVVEAVACGAHVLASPYVGAAEFVRPPWVTVATLDPQAWSHEIALALTLQTVDSTSNRDRRRDALFSFSQDRVAKEMAEFYMQILSARTNAGEAPICT
jgi:glycosyltransferase involved in cell wall biosynthesis